MNSRWAVKNACGVQNTAAKKVRRGTLLVPFLIESQDLAVATFSSTYSIYWGTHHLQTSRMERSLWQKHSPRWEALKLPSNSFQLRTLRSKKKVVYLTQKKEALLYSFVNFLTIYPALVAAAHDAVGPHVDVDTMLLPRSRTQPHRLHDHAFDAQVVSWLDLTIQMAKNETRTMVWKSRNGSRYREMQQLRHENTWRKVVMAGKIEGAKD